MSQNRINEISACSVYHLYQTEKSEKKKLEILWEHVSDCCFCHPNRFYCDEFLFVTEVYNKNNDPDYYNAMRVVQNCKTRLALLRKIENYQKERKVIHPSDFLKGKPLPEKIGAFISMFLCGSIIWYPLYRFMKILIKPSTLYKFPYYADRVCLSCLLEHPSAGCFCDGYVSAVKIYWALIPDDEVQIVKLITKNSQRPPLSGLRFMTWKEVEDITEEKLAFSKSKSHKLVKKLLKQGILEKNVDGIRVNI